MGFLRTLRMQGSSLALPDLASILVMSVDSNGYKFTFLKITGMLHMSREAGCTTPKYLLGAGFCTSLDLAMKDLSNT